MKRQKLRFGYTLTVAVAATGIGSLFAAVPFDSATLTRVENKVSIGVIKDGKAAGKRVAAVSDIVTAHHFVQTASESRAELEFKDKSLVRVGQNSVFTFDSKSRTLTLEKGDMLFYVPPGSGGGTIKTPAITAAITGTLCKVSEEMIAVLRGSIMVLCGKEQKMTKVTAGWAVQVVNGKCKVFQFDPSQATKGKLYTMGPLPEDPGIEVAEDGTLLAFPNSHDQNAVDSGQVNPNVDGASPPPQEDVVVTETPPPKPPPKHHTPPKGKSPQLQNQSVNRSR